MGDCELVAGKALFKGGLEESCLDGKLGVDGISAAMGNISYGLFIRTPSLGVDAPPFALITFLVFLCTTSLQLIDLDPSWELG